MEDKWQKKSLGVLYDFRSGLSKPRTEFGSGFPFLTFKDVFYNTFVPDQLGDLVNSTESERTSCNIIRGDVFLTRTSETMEELGMSSVALEDIPNATFNGFTKRLRPKSQESIVPEFAGYYFRSPMFRIDVTAMSSQSTRASLNNDMLGRLKMPLPPLNIQRSIGNALKVLDDKIKQNCRTNKVLESMARAIFKAWFVDFEPVKAKAAGATSFPGMPQEDFDRLPDKLVETELGAVPEGWAVQAVSKIAQYVNGKAFTKHANGQGRMIIRIAELNSGPGGATKYSDVETEPEYTAFPNDLLFAWSGSLGVHRWHRDEAIINQHIFKVIPKDFPQWYVFYRLVEAMPFFQAIASTKATTMGHIKRGHLDDAIFTKPPQFLVDAADEQIRPLYDLIHRNEREMLALENIRDALLPKLISGEIRIGESYA